MKKHIVVTQDQLKQKLLKNPNYISLFKVYDYRNKPNNGVRLKLEDKRQKFSVLLKTTNICVCVI